MSGKIGLQVVELPEGMFAIRMFDDRTFMDYVKVPHTNIIDVYETEAEAEGMLKGIIELFPESYERSYFQMHGDYILDWYDESLDDCRWTICIVRNMHTGEYAYPAISPYIQHPVEAMKLWIDIGMPERMRTVRGSCNYDLMDLEEKKATYIRYGIPCEAQFTN